VVTGLRRELEYHHVDLAAGDQPASWPDDFAATELSLVTDLMNRREGETSETCWCPIVHGR
jgi:maleylpyruvate isomerase